MVARAGALTAAAAAVVLLACGCTTVVPGTVRPAPGLAPTPVTGMAVRQVLLDDNDVSKIVGQPFRGDPNLPPRFGGRDELPDAWATAEPQDCVGVAVGGQRSVYGSADVRDIAHELWDSDAAGAPLTGVAEAVIALDSTASANALVERFSEQWNNCQGIVVTRFTGGGAVTGEVTAVATEGTVLTATVVSTMNGISGLRVSRALAAWANCVVDVDVFWSANRAGPDLPPAGDTTAVELVRAMLDRVRGLSG
ncbi:sensor domain-containing protein [Mycolicibacter minnesotensis]